MLILFNLDSWANKVESFGLLCKPEPEGIHFGLWFENGEVTQLGIQEFKMVIDYKEPFKTLKNNNFKWLKVTLTYKTLTLKLGAMSNHFAKCTKIIKFNDLVSNIEKVIMNKMIENTI